jgi:AcrR family transcriptional regulator
VTRTRERKSAEERREQILAAAMAEFAEHGLDGATTQEIARRVEVSQPYVFHLFGSKKQLFVATVERCFEETRAMFVEAMAGKTGEEALHAMGTAYVEELRRNPRKLRAQMQSYVACSDPEICVVVRRGFGGLVRLVEDVSGLPPERVAACFAKGMLLNVVASMGVLDADEPWAARLLDGLQRFE